MNTFKSVTDKLIGFGLRFEEITFEDEVISARDKDTSVDHNYEPRNAIKTLVVKTKDDFFGIILRGDQKIYDKKLTAILGKWSVIDEKTLLDKFGFIPGTVCPLVLNIPLLVDEDALNMPVWSMGAGDIKKGINVKSEEILKVIKFEQVDISHKNIMNNTFDEKLNLITRNCQEVLTAEDLKRLVESGEQINHYIGFEISGMVHLGTGLMSMGKIADFLKAGVKCKIFLADFHTYLNNKLGGDWDNIRWASENYFKEALIASLACYGVDEKEVEFVSGKKLYEDNPTHWETFMRVGKHVTLSRNLRSISIMGKKQGADVDMATLFYPPLQVADIFTMGINLAHAGIDQRKAHVIAREVGEKIGKWTPVAIHQNLIAGLTAPAPGTNDAESLKMSKSVPNSAIFVHDSPDEIKSKIAKAYGPPKETEFNPLINWVQTLVFWGDENGEFTVTRPEKFGGNKTYTKFGDLVDDYQNEKLHPMDLKNALAEWLIVKLEPARSRFEQPKQMAALDKMRSLMAK